jgi:hypothetical protein
MPSHDEMLAFNKLFEKHPQFPTICIECVPKGTELPYIRYIIGELWLGLDVQVNMIPLPNRDGGSRVFIHVGEWSSREDAVRIRYSLLNGIEVKIDHNGNTNDVDMWTLLPLVSKYQKAFTIWQERCPSRAEKPPSFGPTIHFGDYAE